jgi:serine protease Do
MNLKIRNNILFCLLITFLFQNCNSRADEKIYSESSPQKQSPGSVSDEVSASRQNAITRAVKAVSPAVVGINVTEVVQYQYRDPFFDDPFFRQFFGEQGGRGRTRQYEVHGLGSGFIISPDGYILTNHHVAGNASKIIVTMTDGKKYDARIIGADMTTDVDHPAPVPRLLAVALP